MDGTRNNEYAEIGAEEGSYIDKLWMDRELLCTRIILGAGWLTHYEKLWTAIARAKWFAASILREGVVHFRWRS